MMIRGVVRGIRRRLRRGSFALAQRGLVLDPAFFAGRRVLIVGPARGARDELRSLVGVRFDIVVRMNNGIALAGDGPFPGTDILFHNFKEEGERSAGLLVRSVLDGAGVRYLVFTHPAESRGWQLLKARLRVTRLGCTAALRIPPPDWYAGLSRRFGRWEPTTGSVAIALVLAGAPKNVNPTRRATITRSVTRPPRLGQGHWDRMTRMSTARSFGG